MIHRFTHSFGSITSVVIVFLVLGYVYLVHDRWRHEMDDERKAAQNELDLLASLVKNDLQQGNYQHTSELLQHWGGADPQVQVLQLSAENGFVLSQYKSADTKKSDQVISSNVVIAYSYTGNATLSLQKDLDVVHAHIRIFAMQLGGAVLLIGVMLGSVARLLSLYRKETLHLQQLAVRLHEANAALSSEVVHRNQLEQDKERMLSILEATTDLVGMADPQGNIIYLNQAGRSMVGVNDWKFNAVQLQDFHPPWARNIVINEGLPAAAQLGSWTGEIALLDANGNELQVSQLILGHKDTQNKVLYYSTIIRDITRIRAAEDALKNVNMELEVRVLQRTEEAVAAMEQAKRANEAKSEFLSRMSHELRTPMNAILGFGQLLKQNKNNNLDADDIDCIDEILKGGQHLLNLINEVLDLSRIESGNMKLTMEGVEFNELVDECIALIRPLADQNGITLSIPGKATPVMVFADRVRLKQVMLNLLSNAVKYNRECGTVELSCQAKENRYRIFVSDTGSGIPLAMQHRVYDPFDRLNADVGQVDGTGIGLSLVKRLVELMGGEVGFSSVEGEGSCFFIELNIAHELPQTKTESMPTVLPGSLDHEHNVLYVEDNPANLRLVSSVLRKIHGIHFYDAHNATLAMEMIRAHNFDLILLDVYFAGAADGYDILRKLRSDPITKSIPVVAVSADATPVNIDRGLKAGFDEYLTKPINIDQFSEIVVKLIHDREQGGMRA